MMETISIGIGAALLGIIFGFIIKLKDDKIPYKEFFQRNPKLKKTIAGFVVPLLLLALLPLYEPYTIEPLSEWSNNIALKNAVVHAGVGHPAQRYYKDGIPKKITEEDITFNGLQLLSDLQSIQKILRIQPQKESGTYGNLYLFDKDVQVTVSRLSQKVSGIYLLSDKYETPRGIRVGDSVKTVVEFYGDPDHIFDKIPDEPNGRAYEYFLRNTDNFIVLRFLINQDDQVLYIGADLRK